MNYKRSLSLHIIKTFLRTNIFKQNYSPIAATLGTTDGKSDDDEVTEEGTDDDDDGATVDVQLLA